MNNFSTFCPFKCGKFGQNRELFKHFSLVAGTEGDHLVGVNEMIGNYVFGRFAYHSSALDNL